MGIEPDAFVLLQPTSPFRELAELEEAIRVFRSKTLRSLLGVVPVMHHPADYVSRQRADGPLSEVFTRPPGVRRQDLSPMYFISGALYVCDCAWYREKQRFYDQDSYLFQMSEGTLLDIDTPFDLRLARGYLLAAPQNV
jgi:CMP-N-acetylneuraminic acid synthetase